MEILVKGAWENNLKNITVSIPKNKLVVFTGLSGSGKSTLALETLQRECQRQYMESMGMTLAMGLKPKVDVIEGLSPAISINQHQSSRNPRSTVGTVTEIGAYLRVLFSKLGQRPCPHCGLIMTQNNGGMQEQIDSETPIEETESAEILEQMTSCPNCYKPVIELTASHFSFNKPQGACQTCHGLGIRNMPDVTLLMDDSKSILQGAVKGWDQVFIDRYSSAILQAAKHYGFEMNIDLPINQYNEVQTELLLFGVLGKPFQKRFPDVNPPKTVPEGRFEGVVTNLLRRYSENNSSSARQKLEKYFIRQECEDCQGVRFRKEILEVQVCGVNIKEILSCSLMAVMIWLEKLSQELSPEAYEITRQVIDDIQRRIRRLIDAGAGYLNLDQPASSLSAGEWQRIKMASVLGSGLTGVLYVLDEPTAGLHPRDTEKVIGILKQLRDLGNTVLVIEHDREIMLAADHLIDFGPGAGRDGGQIVAIGQVQDLIQCEASITGQFLKDVFTPFRRKKLTGSEGSLRIVDCDVNNLKSVSVEIPLGRLVTVTGVSGSGKTSLIFGGIAEAAESYFQKSKNKGATRVLGLEKLTGSVIIDQLSIGRSSRSNAATYTDLFSDVRDLFAAQQSAKDSGLTAKYFSYNVAGGRCEKCQGSGKLAIAMHFLPDVEVLCPSCRGKRYRNQVLQITYKGYSIADVLDMSVDEAMHLFSEERNLLRRLKTLQEVGLGYLGLGQSTTTLSGGELQRLKLAKELASDTRGKVLYLFDEPTTGLHPYDANRLIDIFDKLVSNGHSVVVIEHNSQVILESDWVIDLGPEGGSGGGLLVAQGTPQDMMKQTSSHTGKVLAHLQNKS